MARPRPVAGGRRSRIRAAQSLSSDGTRVLRVLDWLKSVGHTEIHLAGLGWGALSATFAAVLSDQVVQVTLKNGLTSYRDVAESEDYDWPHSCLLPNVLAHFDLPDCYAELEAKRLRQIDPRSARTD
jgi:hypothetical protein